LGYYDLRNPDIREAQAALAKEHGVEGFCYWHYWLGNGKQLLERPFNEVLESGKPDFPFCLGWANHSWSGNFFGAGKRLLIKQQYLGRKDNDDHFDYLCRAFRDSRYIKVEGKPLFIIFAPYMIPDAKGLLNYWRLKAIKAGLKGIFIVGQKRCGINKESHGLDGLIISRHREIGFVRDSFILKSLRTMNRKLGYPIGFFNRTLLQCFSYQEASRYFLKNNYGIDVYPNIVPNWDNTARYKYDAVVLKDAGPELFRLHVRSVLEKLCDHPNERKLAFIRSWNEWAEGNYIEPDERFGRRYLEVLKEEVLGQKI
jgi:hypothetical protein